MANNKMLLNGIEQMGLSVHTDEQHKLLDYLLLLQKWNKVFNLTAIHSTEQMLSHHVLDSLAVLPHLWSGRWLDVGCGAGLPGLVLALVRPEWHFTLLDSNSKKTGFVQQAVIELGLRNVSVCCSRVQDWQDEEKFDGIISRAFADTAVFTSLTRHLLAQDGRWVAMKGMPEKELDCLPVGVEVEKVVPLQVPGLNAKRCLVILKAI